MQTPFLFFFLSLVFSPFASAIAFIITYEEYTKHIRKREAMRQAIETALFTSIVFIVLVTVAGIFFNEA